jgi:aspartate aminotransferase-like enzyme
MTAEPHGRKTMAPFLAAPEKTPRAIRAALLPEEVGDFDREFRSVMAEATETLDLTVVTSFIERWWRVAWSSADAAGHRAMLDQADRLTRGEAIPTRSWAEIKARLGL